jgi:hypothetical protein
VRACEARFRAWYATTVDLPGTYYLQAVEWLFKEHRLAAGRLVALGQRIDLAAVRQPVFQQRSKPPRLGRDQRGPLTAPSVGRLRTWSPSRLNRKCRRDACAKLRLQEDRITAALP